MRSIKSIWPLLFLALALPALSGVCLLTPSQASAQDLPTVTIVKTYTSVAEGEDARFLLFRTGSTSQTLQVRLRTHEPTHPDISGGVNPTVQLHRVDFAAGARSTSFSVIPDLDAVAETTDSIVVTVFALSSSPYVVGEQSESTVTITDTAPVVTIAADQTTVAEGDTATYTLTRTASTKRALEVGVTVSDPASYLRGNHWQPDPVLPTTATFPIGSRTTTISLETMDDLRDISNHVLLVVLNSGTAHYTLGNPSSARTGVTDNDVAPTITLSSDSMSVEEGETFVITMNITGGSGNSIPITVSSGFEGQVGTQFPLDVSGSTMTSQSVSTGDNDLDEPDRVYTFGISLARAVPAGAVSEYLRFRGGSSISVTVRDNDLPQVYVEALKSSYTELETGQFKISRIGQTDEALVINANASQTGNDVHETQQHLLGAVNGKPRTWTIEASKESVTVDLRLSGLDGDEDDGSVTMAILSGDHYRVDPQKSSATFLVIDSDPMPVIDLGDVSPVEEGGYVKFTVLFEAAHPSRRSISVAYYTTDGTATSVDDADFTAATGVLTVSPGVSSAIISVPTTDDRLPEPNENFFLTLSNPVNATMPSGTNTLGVNAYIEDNEPTITITAQDSSVTEGESAVFLLERTGSAESEFPVYVHYLVEAGTETIEAKDLPVVFPAGDSQTTWSYATPSDLEDKPDLVITAWLRDTREGEPPWPYHHDADDYALVRVEDNDEPIVNIEAVHSSRTEGQDAQFTFTRQGVLDDALTVTISVKGAGNFVSGARPTTVTFDAGSATADLTVATVDDDPVDSDALLVVEIATTQDHYRVADPGSATVALYDSDEYRPSVFIETDNDAVVTEGDDAAFVLGRSSYDSDKSLTVQVQVTVTTGVPISLSDGVSTAVSTQEVVFDANSRTATLTIPTVDEELNDGNSSVEALLKTGQYTIRGYPGKAIVWVKDDDVPTVTMTPETGEVLENPPDGTEFTVLRTGDTTNWLRLKRLTWQDRRWPEEILSPSYLAFVEDSKTPLIDNIGPQDFRPGEASNTFKYDPRGTGPLGTTAYVEILPIYCPDVIPGDCGYRPQYQVGTPKSSTIEVLNRDMGVRVMADQASVKEGASASFTLHRYGGTKLSRQSSLTVRVQVTQNGEFIDGMPPQTVTFSGSLVDGEDAEVNSDTPEGAASATITIPTDDDLIIEGDGTITLTILGPDPDSELVGTYAHTYELWPSVNFLADSGWASFATVEVLDNDDEGFIIADASADEGDGSLRFTVTRVSNPLETSADWATEEDTDGDHPATAGVDYLAASDTLTFAPGITSQALTVMVNDEDLSEHHETFLVRLSNPVNTTLVDPVATGTITDDDRVTIEVGVSSSDQSITVPEGGRSVYELVLGHQPTGDVTVTVTVNDTANNDVTTEEASLVFTDTNWNEPQTVTVLAAEDDDAITDPDVTISHSASGANYEGVTVPALTVTIIENDAVGVTIEPATLTVTEGDATGADYTVVLASQPAGDVTVTVSGHSGTDLTLSGTGLSSDGALTFTTANWSAAQTVTVKAAEDDDAAPNDDVTLTHAITSDDDSMYNALADQTVTVTITENDEVGVTIDPNEITVEEGDTTGVSYTVALTSQPAGDVTVTISGHAGSDLTLSGTGLSDDGKLTFTADNWGTAQTVTVKAAEDDDAVTNADVFLAHAITSDDDATYNALADQYVTVFITEADSAGVTITPTSMTVLEGRSNSYTVQLNSQPTTDVTVAISGHSGATLTLSGTTLVNDSLTFTSSNWNTAQTITVTAGAVTADTDVTLTHAIGGGDYDSVPAADVVVTVLDVPANQVTIQVGVTVSRQALTVPEGGSNTYKVVLGHQPTGDVTVTVTVDDTANNDVTTEEASLVFTTANWNEPQTVTVRAAEDDDAVTDDDVTISHTVGGANYEGVTVPALTVSITENESAGVTITPTYMTVLEGRSNSYTVKLNSRPTTDVTVAISGHSGATLTLSGTALVNDSLTFTSSNWNTAQTVTVTAGAVTADADVTLAHAIGGGDYDSVTAADVVVTVVDVPVNQPTIQVGVSVSRQNLAVPEGGSNIYEVVLARRPTGDVTVTVTVDDTANNDVTTEEASLVFTTANWNVPQTVTVRAAEDDDALTDPGVDIRHTVGGADYEGVTAPWLRVSITEDDAVGVTIKPTTLTVTEGDATGVDYTVVLTSKPAGDVTVTISGHAGTDLTVTSAGLNTDDQLTFTADNWSTAQTVTVKAAHDDDGVTDADISLTHDIASTDDTTYNALADQTVTVSITEDDAVGVTIKPTTLTVTEGDATGVDYTVVLTSKPAGDVTVTISGHAGTDLTLSGTSLSNDGKLTFTTANWGTAQTVTVKAAHDDDGVQDADVSLAHDIASTDDAAYDALSDQSVTVSITEDDAVGVTISQTTLTVTEGDATGVNYTVVLTSKPAGDVTVTISGHAGTDLTLSGTSLSNDGKLTFTTANWGTAQTVTVKAAHDDDGVADADVSLAHDIASADDTTYNALADQTVTVSITEDDAVGVTINPTTLSVTEGDATGVNYTVVLTSKPAGDVTVTISGHASTDLTLSGTSLSNDGKLTFTTANWGTAQTVTVKAAHDDDGVQDADVSLAHDIASADDTGYDALADQTVTVSITEDDMVGVTISPTTLTVTEGDATGVDYTVVLTSKPAGDVTVTISGHAGTDLTLSGTSLSNDGKLTFTTANWSAAQTVTVKAAHDDDGVADADISLTHDIASADDATYDALADQTVTVSITEDDAVGVTINPTTLSVTEGDATGVNYTVVLTSKPAGDVTVTISGHAGTDLTLSGTSLSNDGKLTFTTANWGTAQTVTVKAAHDDDGVTDADISLAHDIASADDTGYNALADQTVTVSITEDDAVGVTIKPTTLSVTEGNATGVDYTVVLTSKPAGDVTVTISGHAGTDLTLSGTSLSNDGKLTFTTANWSAAQTVTVKAAHDDDGVTDADISLTHDIASTDDTTYNALADQTVTVSITEDDAVGVTISQTTLTVTEGDATGIDYTVVLTSKPAGNVTVTISGHASTDLTVTSAGLNEDGALTFTADNWSTAQTVTVKAAHDDDGVADADISLAHDIASTDDTGYDALADQTVTVSITEDDMVGVTISPTTLTVTEGDATGVDYTVVLTSKPAGDVTVTISGHAGTDLTLSGTSLSNDGKLTFTADNWSTAQTVTVKAAHDDDGVADADISLAHDIASTDDTGYDALADQTVTVSITEDDMVGVTISPTTLTVTEGDATGVEYTVVLTSKPAGDVTVTISGHSGTDLTVTSAGLNEDGALTFTADNWATAQTVTVKAAHDDDGVSDADVSLAHDIASADDATYNALADQTVTVSITEDDVVGVTINPTTLSVTEGDATGVEYTVVLTSKPAGDVTVTISGHSGTDLSIASAGLSGDNELTFSTANWSTAQTVTVKAAHDDDGVTDADVSLAHDIASADDATYNALADQTVTVSITEDDVVGVTINPTTLSVTEGDATGVNYTVVLTSKPAGDVTVTISGHASTDLTLSGTSLSNDGKLTFTTANWGTAQTVTVKAAHDDDGVTDADVSLAHDIASADDATYNALADQTVTVSITEDDVVGVTISPTTLSVTEGDATGVEYTVVLTSKPAGDVTVTISGHSGTDLTVTSPGLNEDGALTFTTANWSTAQTVTVKAAHDDDGVTDADVSLAHDIASADDTTYNALADQTVTVSITEDDAVGVTINPTTLSVTEGDATGVNYTVVLTSKPAGDVTVTISGHASTDLTLSGTSLSNDGKLTFTTANWGTAQTVTVKAAHDDDGVQDADVSLAHDIASADDTGYDALADQTVTVSITEDDMVGVTISPTTLTVTEGDATGVDYTVVLTSKPAGDVTVTISGHAGTDLTLSGTSLSNDGKLTFTTANWSAAQTVTVKAAHDDDGVADADISLTHDIASADDATYDALADQTVTVSITEDDAVGVTINPTTLSVTEGDATGVNYTVVLTSKPAGDVTVTISGHSGTDLTVTSPGLNEDGALTFTADNWSTAQTVTVKAAHDDDGVTDADVSLAHDIASADDATYNALADQTVTVSITEDDQAAIGVKVSFEKEVHYTVEGASGVAGVELFLSAPLQTEVTIPITVLSQSTADPEDYAVSDSGGYASDPGLTFSPGETFGYVFIKAVLDTVDEETETVVLGFGTLPEGVIEGSPNRSTVEIRDAIQVSFADSTYMVQEGGPGVEVMVKLNKPGNNLHVPLTADGEGGADESDFTGVPQEVVFEDDETEKTFTFVAMKDTEEENGEMVNLGFGAFDEGMVAVFPDSAMVMIGDDAGAPAPRHFTTSWPTQTSITLTWFTVETAAEYKLEYRKQGESEWTRISGDFDHLPSTSDHRFAFGVAAGLDCNTQYDFRVSDRGDGSLRNDGSGYSATLFGSYATTSARTGECAQEEEVTNLLVSVEPRCATLTWTPPSGDRDTGYRVERYSYTNNRSQRSEWETLLEQANHVADRYEDCSAAYRTEGADHVYIISALDDEEEAFGTAYTPVLPYGASSEPEGPLNVRLTHDTPSSRRLAWDGPRDRWLTTVKTARAGFGRQQVTRDPWVTGYRVERREYRRTEDGNWFLDGDWDTLRDETDGDAGTSFTDAEDKGDKQYVYRVWAHNDWGLSRYSRRGDWAFNGGDPGGNPGPEQHGSETPPNTAATGLPSITGTPQVDRELTADTSAINDADGLTNVSYSYQWIANGGSSDADIEEATDPSYTPSPSDVGKTIRVRVTFTDDKDNEETLTSEATVAVAATVPTAPQSLTVAAGDQDQELDVSWQAPSSNGGSDVTGYRVQWKEAAGSWDTPADVSEATVTGTTHTITSLTGGVEYAVRVQATNSAGDGPASTEAKGTPTGSASEQVVEPDNSAPTGLPSISGTPQVDQTLTADTSSIDDADGLTNVSYEYQWLAGGTDIAGATGFSHTLAYSELGKTIQVRVTFTDDADNDESLTSAATVAVAAAPNRAATGQPTISGTPQVEETLTADTSSIDDADGLDNVSYEYQWLASSTDIAGATGSSYQLTSSEEGKTIQVKVTFTDDRGNSESLTSEASDAVAAKPVPLTATFSNVPDSHSGSGFFTFDLAFSENFPLSYRTLRDHAFIEDDHGPVTKAQRKVQGSNQTWTITIEPSGNGAITIKLPATTDCNASGAICTSDGRMLSNSISVSVAGPN